MEPNDREIDERLKAALARQNAAMDARADTLLERLKDSPWTAAILLLVGLFTLMGVVRFLIG